ncbi:MAG: leucine-rich repeat domain-containing protein [Lactobacillus sp.]|nr:leucine-rich repeat domain-containing protein [Lactobacillus sp.]
MDDMTCQVDGGHAGLTHLNIPGIVTFKGREFAVKSISQNAFEGSDIESVAINGGVERIYSKAFYLCEKLVKVDLGTVKIVDEDAFNGCRMLSDLDLGMAEEIQARAFHDCSILNLEIPGTVKLLGEDSFNIEECDSIVFQAGETTLEISYKFKNGAKIYLDRNICHKGGYIYNRYINIEFGENVSVFPSYLGRKLEKCDLSNTNIRIIESRAFGEDLSEIILPETLDSIYYSAFENARIKEIKLPDGLSDIGSSAFEGCKNLTELEIPGSVKEIKDLFGGYKGNLKSLKLNEGTEIVGVKAFKYMPLESVDFPTTISTIMTDAFYGCDKLTKLSIPVNVKTIEGGAFNGCTAFFNVQGDDRSFHTIPLMKP